MRRPRRGRPRARKATSTAASAASSRLARRESPCRTRARGPARRRGDAARRLEPSHESAKDRGQRGARIARCESRPGRVGVRRTRRPCARPASRGSADRVRAPSSRTRRGSRGGFRCARATAAPAGRRGPRPTRPSALSYQSIAFFCRSRALVRHSLTRSVVRWSSQPFSMASARFRVASPIRK